MRIPALREMSAITKMVRYQEVMEHSPKGWIPPRCYALDMGFWRNLMMRCRLAYGVFTGKYDALVQR